MQIQNIVQNENAENEKLLHNDNAYLGTNVDIETHWQSTWSENHARTSYLNSERSISVHCSSILTNSYQNRFRFRYAFYTIFTIRYITCNMFIIKGLWICDAKHSNHIQIINSQSSSEILNMWIVWVCVDLSARKMPSYKLTYFNFKGRGELMRLIFAAAGQQFTDNRIEMAQWPAVKPSASLLLSLELILAVVLRICMH